MAAILNIDTRLTSVNDDRIISESDMAKNKGVDFEIAVHLSPLSSYFHFRFSGHYLEFR